MVSEVCDGAGLQVAVGCVGDQATREALGEGAQLVVEIGVCRKNVLWPERKSNVRESVLTSVMWCVNSRYLASDE